MDYTPGWKTSEFWLTVAIHILTLLIASGALAKNQRWSTDAALILSALTQYSYNKGRSSVKTAAALPTPIAAQAAGVIQQASSKDASILKPSLSLLLAACMLSCLFANAGCTPGGPYIAADRSTYNAIAPSYTGYVQADPNLTDARKAEKLRTLATWDLRLRQAEGGSSTATTQPAATQP